MEKREIAKSELVLTDDKRIYHLHLKPEEIADTILLVGDPGRVKLISSYFDIVETVVENREFVTHTGVLNGKHLSAVSTGIGTDNIDIVINELDALANIDLDTRMVKTETRKLRFIRMGTSGALHAEIEPGNVIVAQVAGGLDNLMYFYDGIERINDQELTDSFVSYMNWKPGNSKPYFIPVSPSLLALIDRPEYFKGITLAAPGFYAPQGRSLRLAIHDTNYVDKISAFRSGDLRINNFEMEGSALYGLSRHLGHDALTVCIALANRITGKFATDYQPYIKKLIENILERVTGDE